MKHLFILYIMHSLSKASAAELMLTQQFNIIGNH